ncbi:MAG: hypothetical protein ACOH10_07790 [Rhodoglobus sp.]
MTTCTGCAKDLEPIDAFPGGRCLACYAADTANDPLPTADELARMWGWEGPKK